MLEDQIDEEEEEEEIVMTDDTPFQNQNEETVSELLGTLYTWIKILFPLSNDPFL